MNEKAICINCRNINSSYTWIGIDTRNPQLQALCNVTQKGPFSYLGGQSYFKLKVQDRNSDGLCPDFKPKRWYHRLNEFLIRSYE